MSWSVGRARKTSTLWVSVEVVRVRVKEAETSVAVDTYYLWIQLWLWRNGETLAEGTLAGILMTFDKLETLELIEKISLF